MKDQSDSNSTYEKLLDAGGEVFADRGFKAATIRDISQRAGANVAAVNYHFGDKLKLFEVIINRIEESWHVGIPEVHRQISETDDDLEKLKIFIRHVFSWGLNSPKWNAELLHRIFHNPDSQLDAIFNPMIQKRFAVACGIVRMVMGNDVDDEDVRLCTFSMIAQFVFFFHKPVPIKNDLHLDPRNKDELVKIIDHISKFTLAGINAYRN